MEPAGTNDDPRGIVIYRALCYAIYRLHLCRRDGLLSGSGCRNPTPEVCPRTRGRADRTRRTNRRISLRWYVEVSRVDTRLSGHRSARTKAGPTPGRRFGKWWLLFHGTAVLPPIRHRSSRHSPRDIRQRLSRTLRRVRRWKSRLAPHRG